MSIAEKICVPGQNAILNFQNVEIGWTLETLHLRRWNRNQFYADVTLVTHAMQCWRQHHYCELGPNYMYTHVYENIRCTV